MMIRHERSGGFAGLSVTAEIDTETLPAKEATELKNLMGKAFPANEPINQSDAMPDQFTYSFTIKDGKKTKTIAVSDENLTAEIRALSKWLIAKATAEKK